MTTNAGRGRRRAKQQKLKDITAKVTQYYKNNKHEGAWSDVDYFIWVEVADEASGLHVGGLFVKNLHGDIENVGFPTYRLLAKEYRGLVEFVEDYVATHGEPTTLWTKRG